MTNIKGQCSLYCISTPSLVAIETSQGICIPQGSIIEIWNQQIAWWIRTAICLEGWGLPFFGGDFGKNSGWIIRLVLCLSKSLLVLIGRDYLIPKVETENLGHVATHHQWQPTINMVTWGNPPHLVISVFQTWQATHHPIKDCSIKICDFGLPNAWCQISLDM